MLAATGPVLRPVGVRDWLYSHAMSLLLDSFWRAVAYCVHPRVIALSFLPLILMVLLSFGLGYFFWEGAVASVALWLTSFELVETLLAWMDQIGMGSLRGVFAPLLVLVLATPVIVLLCLLLVAMFMTPAMVDLVALRRFPALERKHGGSLVVSVLWSFGSTLLAIVVLVISMPLWLVPPLVLILPPLIWGWLTYRFSRSMPSPHTPAATNARPSCVNIGEACCSWVCSVAIWVRHPVCCGPRARCSLPWHLCWCHWPSGSTRWYLPLHLSGSHTLRWPPCSGCAPWFLSRCSTRIPRVCGCFKHRPVPAN